MATAAAGMHLGAALDLGDALLLLANHVVARGQLRAQRVNILLQPADGLSTGNVGTPDHWSTIKLCHVCMLG